MINNTTLTGRIVKEPELRFTPKGVEVCSFRLAVNRKYKKEGQPEADFINIVCFKSKALNLVKYVSKGDTIGVEGMLQSRFYEEEGKRIYVTEVIANDITFLSLKGKSHVEAKEHENVLLADDTNYSFGFDITDENLPF